MGKRDQQIVEAAARVFARYGIGKTTMGDIAAEAGVARQTLYNAFDGKDAVLRAVVRMAMDQALQQIRAGWAETADLGDRLQVFFDHGPIGWYDQMQAMPDSAQFLEGLHKTAQEEKLRAARLWSEALAGILSDHRPALTAAGMTPEEYADFIYNAAVNAKYDAPTRAALLSRLAALRASVLSLTGVRAA